MPTLPVTPETLDELRGRFPLALAHVYDVEALLDGGIRPGECRENTFDFGPGSGSDGLRLIVGRERLPGGRTHLHVSASVEAGSPLFRRLRRVPRHGSPISRAAWCRDLVRVLAREVQARFADLSGGRGPGLELRILTRGGVLHFHAPDPGGSTPAVPDV